MNESQGAHKHASTWLLSVLVIAAVGAQAGRIVSTRSATGETPFHSANDRSRWCSVAAIGGYGQFEIDQFLQIRDPKTKRLTWNTIDLVRHRGRDGKQHYYSSKPPLLSVIHAGVYVAVRLVTGLSLVTETFTAARIILVLVNLLPLTIFWWLWLRYWQRRNLSEWTLVVMVTFMVWGTFVTTFANTLNNHLPGAIAAGVSLWAALKIIEDRRGEWRWFVLSGAAAAFCAVCELPALSWAAALALLLVQVAPLRATLGLLTGAAPIAAAFAVTNFLAHGDLKPPYAHRAVGELITTLPRQTNDAANNISKADESAVIETVRKAGYQVSSAASVKTTRTPGVQELWDDETQLRFALVARGNQIQIHQWDDWYDYPNSYWYPERKRGVDLGETSRLKYLFHATFGHHGIFSLTPMWLLLPFGMWVVWTQSSGPTWSRLMDFRSQLMIAIAATTLVCFVFYMLRPLEDRNYGGVSSGFRWMFWFTPLWCWLIAYALERITSSRTRVLVLIALGVSVFSATLPWTNPWTAPWLTHLYQMAA